MKELIDLVLKHEKIKKSFNTKISMEQIREKDVIEQEMYEIAKRLKKEMDNDGK